jgi:hypothetical protein
VKCDQVDKEHEG